jgi:oligopeptide transport system ATP-binding protein
MILGLQRPTSGSILFEGKDIFTHSRAAKAEFRRQVQAVFQDPWGSLNPRMRVRDIIGEPLDVNRRLNRLARSERIGTVMADVGLDPAMADRFPHEFSGGQRQRIAIARALTLEPRLIVLDEPVSALDVSIRAQILNLLKDLQRERGIAYLMVSHDLATVRYMCDRVAVMYLGVIQEIGPTADVFDNPLHVYTKALISAVPPLHPDADSLEIVLPGEPVSPIDPPAGDVFMARSPLPVDPAHRWARERPPLVELRPGHWAVATPWSLAENLLLP